MSWDTGLGSEQTVLQNLVTTDGVGGSKQLPFSFSFQPGFQRRQLWTFQLCTFDLDKPGALQWDFYDASSERNFLFIFFSLGRSNLQPVSYNFLPHSSSYLPRTQLEYLHGSEREVAVVRSQSQPTALQYSICATAVQYLPAGSHSALLFPSCGQTSPPGAAGLDWGAAGSSHQQSVLLGHPHVVSVMNVSSRGHQANAWSLQEGSLLDPFGFFLHVSPYILMCLILPRAWGSEQDQSRLCMQIYVGG